MFELLEDLPPKFKKKFDKEVNITEITRYSLQINDKTWVIVTNSNVYILQKKLLFIKTTKYKLTKVTSSRVESSDFVIEVHSGKESLKINNDRVQHVAQLANKIQQIAN